MFDFHEDRKRYFDMQLLNAEKYLLPFIEQVFTISPGMRVLEIGCGEGGVLKAFLNKGCTGVGVELEEGRAQNGAVWLAEDIEAKRLSFVVRDIYDVAPEELGGRFDIIVLKDVIEHIHNQPKLIGWLHLFLKTKGVVFFGFPPWQMPFGGHQQMCRNKKLSKLPYFHLLPRPLYRKVLSLGGEPIIDALMEVRDTRISIEDFESMAKRNGYTIVHRLHYLVNPIYEWKFGWKPKEQFRIISRIPFVRNYLTTCVYYLIQPVTKRE